MAQPLLRYRRWWLVIGAVLVGIVIYASLTPTAPIPDVKGADKLEHIFAYGTLMGWFAQIEHANRRRVWYALGFVAMGVGLEVIQGLMGDRTFSGADMAANGAGVLLAWLVALRVDKVLVWVERFLP